MSAFHVDIKNQIAILTFDLEGEKINKISSEVGKELETILNRLKVEEGLKGLILISAKPDIFIAGADINEILSITTSQEGTEKSLDAQRLPTLVEHLPFPTVAAIHGACLGGGTELALGFKYRIATDDPKTKIGLPEVSLGILPGMGGCVRLPKLVGLQNALDMILAAKSWQAQKCLKTGLVDEVVPKEILLERAIQVIELGLWKKKKRKKLTLLSLLLEQNRLGRNLVYKKAKEQILKKTGGHYPAPLKALDVIYETLDHGITDALKIEAQGFGDLSDTGVSKNLIGIFFLQEKMKKQKGVEDPNIQPRKIESSAVIGAGAMGGGIAQLLSFKDISTRLKDIHEKAVAQGLAHAHALYAKLVERKKLTKRELDQKMSLIHPTTDYTGFKHADMAIEAVVENIEVKQKVFLELEKRMHPQAILATNTSSLSISDIGENCSKKDRVIGLHFFNPVHKMPLIEVVVAEETSPQAIVTTVDFAKRIGKVPIVVKNKAGFLVNRILMPYMNEAAYLLEEAIPMTLIDKVMVQFGMPMGPFTLLDAVGIDIAQKAAHVMYKTFGERMKPHEVLDRVVQAGYLGMKNKKGFYKNKKENTSIYSIIGVKPRPQDYVSEEWSQRMVLLMINEAALCLEEKIVKSPEVVDIGMVFGIGFPPFRGGLLKYADQLSSAKILSELQILHRRYGDRFKPASLLETMAGQGGRFYGN